MTEFAEGVKRALDAVKDFRKFDAQAGIYFDLEGKDTLSKEQIVCILESMLPAEKPNPDGLDYLRDAYKGKPSSKSVEQRFVEQLLICDGEYASGWNGAIRKGLEIVRSESKSVDTFGYTELEDKVGKTILKIDREKFGLKDIQEIISLVRPDDRYKAMWEELKHTEQHIDWVFILSHVMSSIEEKHGGGV